jgi:hypothetical protein
MVTKPTSPIVVENINRLTMAWYLNESKNPMCVVMRSTIPRAPERANCHITPGTARFDVAWLSRRRQPKAVQ